MHYWTNIFRKLLFFDFSFHDRKTFSIGEFLNRIFNKVYVKIKINSGFLKNAIHPLKWPYPVIHIVPEILTTVMDSPVPILLGLNIESKKFEDNKYDSVIKI